MGNLVGQIFVWEHSLASQGRTNFSASLVAQAVHYADRRNSREAPTFRIPVPPCARSSEKDSEERRAKGRRRRRRKKKKWKIKINRERRVYDGVTPLRSRGGRILWWTRGSFNGTAEPERGNGRRNRAPTILGRRNGPWPFRSRICI